MVAAYIVLLGVIALQRVVELWVSRRRAERLLARGGIEVGRGHLAVMKALHAAWLLGCGLEIVIFHRPFQPLLGGTMFVLLLSAQILRYWAILTLGERWSVRIIVLPGAPLICRGPYRYLRHPNYLAVVMEGIALPLIHSAWLTATAFTLLNGLLLLKFRIPQEERALRAHGAGEVRPLRSSGSARR